LVYVVTKKDKIQYVQHRNASARPNDASRLLSECCPHFIVLIVQKKPEIFDRGLELESSGGRYCFAARNRKLEEAIACGL
jgi:hypothetical protein